MAHVDVKRSVVDDLLAPRMPHEFFPRHESSTVLHKMGEHEKFLERKRNLALFERCPEVVYVKNERPICQGVGHGRNGDHSAVERGRCRAQAANRHDRLECSPVRPTQ